MKSSWILRATMLACLCGVLPSVVACGAAPGAEADEQSGSVSAALATTGTDGATYRFPAGALLHVRSSRFSTDVPLDGSETTLGVSLPAGDYSVSVTMPTGELLRTLAGRTSRVHAVLLNPTPIAITVLAGRGTPLTLRFDVRGLGEVKFAGGSLDVTASVDYGVTSDARVLFVHDSEKFTAQQFTDVADPGLRSELKVPVGSTFDYSMVLSSDSDWFLSSPTVVCKAVSAAAPGLVPDDWRGPSRLLQQLIGATGTACIEDDGASDILTVQLTRTGPAPWSQTPFLPGLFYRFSYQLQGELGLDVFDGTHLQQSALVSLELPGHPTFEHRLENSGAMWVKTSGTGSTSIELTP